MGNYGKKQLIQKKLNLYRLSKLLTHSSPNIKFYLEQFQKLPLVSSSNFKFS